MKNAADVLTSDIEDSISVQGDVKMNSFSESSSPTPKDFAIVCKRFLEADRIVEPDYQPTHTNPCATLLVGIVTPGVDDNSKRTLAAFTTAALEIIHTVNPRYKLEISERDEQSGGLSIWMTPQDYNAICSAIRSGKINQPTRRSRP